MFHINNNGDIRKCSAHKKPCPYTNFPHFTEIDKAQKFYEHNNNSIISPLKSKKLLTQLSPIVTENTIVPKNGGSYFGVDISENLLTNRLNLWREHIGPEKADTLEQYKHNRDKGRHFHITVISPPEMRQIGYTKVSEMFNNKKATFLLGGIGTIAEGENETWFVTAECEEADKKRAELGLPPKDYHITLGFLHNDIFSKLKNVDTIVIT